MAGYCTSVRPYFHLFSRITADTVGSELYGLCAKSLQR